MEEQNPENINLEEIIRQNKNLVFNTAISFLQNREDAEDITQEVFIEVYHSISRFRKESKISTWLYRITINKCIDHQRKQNAGKRFGFLSSLFKDDSGELKHDKGHFDHPGILMERKEQARYLFKALDKLPENQKTAFILFCIEDLSQKEIAEIMKISPKAVESLVARARQGMKKILEKWHPNEG